MGQWDSMQGEGQGWDPVVVGLQACGPPGATWQLRIPESSGASAPPKGERLHIASLPKQPLSLCWYLGPNGWAEDSEGLGVPVRAPVAPERDRTSVQGTLPWAPTGLGSKRRLGAPPPGCLGAP